MTFEKFLKIAEKNAWPYDLINRITADYKMFVVDTSNIIHDIAFRTKQMPKGQEYEKFKQKTYSLLDISTLWYTLNMVEYKELSYIQQLPLRRFSDNLYIKTRAVVEGIFILKDIL